MPQAQRKQRNADRLKYDDMASDARNKENSWADKLLVNVSVFINLLT